MEELYRQAVMAIIENEFGKILIGFCPKDSTYKFPQGGLSDNEDPIEALRRTLQDELGFNLNTEDIVLMCSEKVSYLFPEKYLIDNDYYIGQEQYVFKIKYSKGMLLIPENNEFAELIWIKPSDLEYYDTKHRTPAYLKAIELIENEA